MKTVIRFGIVIIYLACGFYLMVPAEKGMIPVDYPFYFSLGVVLVAIAGMRFSALLRNKSILDLAEESEEKWD